jgi:anti-sigma B factor antagonist
MEDLSVKKYFSPGVKDVIIVKLTGYVDHSNSRLVEQVISEILNSGKIKIIFDFSELVYMSSAGWGVFVGEIKTVREKGGDIKLASMTNEVSEVYQILEFYHIIDDYNSINDALKSFSKNSELEKETESSKETDETEEEPINKLLELSGVEPHLGEKPQKSNDVLVQEQRANNPERTKKEQNNQPVRTFKTPKVKKRSQKQPNPKIVNMARLPLNEKIKNIISSTPLINIFQIKKELSRTQYGTTQIGLIKLYTTLRTLNLDTKEKRYRYYRSV